MSILRLPNEPRATLPDFATQEEATDWVKALCKDTEDSVLKAWLKHFDVDNDMSISAQEFSRGLRSMGWNGVSKSLFDILDDNGSGTLSLDELDHQQAKLWQDFRKWCVTKFSSVQDMLRRLGGKKAVEEGSLAYDTFVTGVLRLGWTHLKKRGSQDSQRYASPRAKPSVAAWLRGEDRLPDETRRCGMVASVEDDLLFHAIDWAGNGVLTSKQLAFITVERRREEKKQLARVAASKEAKKNKHDRIATREAITNFKRFLKRKFGGYIRAWRTALCPGGSMVLQKTAFLRACNNIGWTENLRQLWKAFDKDDNGSITIDELDLKSAEVLADFTQNFIWTKFSNSKEAFRALDKDGSKRVREEEFYKVLKDYNFNRPAKILFDGLDRYGHKSLVEEDLHFLDEWKPLPFLTAAPNPKAADAFKAMLQSSHRTILKGWRRCLDTHLQNRCNWEQFESACKKLGFKGDVPGAWRALDSELAGYITLQHVDPVASKALGHFRQWAEREFGSVRSAFHVFDADKSKEISNTEFVRCCHIYGFEGNPHELFKALDFNKDKNLNYKELTFLEYWDFEEDTSQESLSRQPTMRARTTDALVTELQRKDEDPAKPKANTAPLSLRPWHGLQVIDNLGRATPIITGREYLPALNAAVAKQDEEVECPALPMDLRMDLLENVYAFPPYRLGQSFRFRPMTTGGQYVVYSQRSAVSEDCGLTDKQAHDAARIAQPSVPQQPRPACRSARARGSLPHEAFPAGALAHGKNDVAGGVWDHRDDIEAQRRPTGSRLGLVVCPELTEMAEMAAASYQSGQELDMKLRRRSRASQVEPRASEFDSDSGAKEKSKAPPMPTLDNLLLSLGEHYNECNPTLSYHHYHRQRALTTRRSTHWRGVDKLAPLSQRQVRVGSTSLESADPALDGIDSGQIYQGT